MLSGHPFFDEKTESEALLHETRPKTHAGMTFQAGTSFISGAGVCHACVYVMSEAILNFHLG